MFRRNESGGWDKQTWVYRYDALDRRIGKGRLKEDGGLEDETRFVWDGSRPLDDGGCGPRPPGATEWATKPLPTAADYKGNGGSVMNGDTLRTTAKTTTTIVTSVGVGYLIYRGVRMLPSLFPPLWPTIPANAAIP